MLFIIAMSGDHQEAGSLGQSSSLRRAVQWCPRSTRIYLLLLPGLCPRLHLTGRPGRSDGHQGVQHRHGLHEEGKRAVVTLYAGGRSVLI